MEAASTEELTSQIERHIIAKEKRNDRLQVCESVRHVGSKANRSVSMDDGEASTGTPIAASMTSTNCMVSLE